MVKGSGGRKPIKFQSGGLHESTDTAPGKRIPAKKRAAARSGALGKKAQKQELFAENVLTGGRKKNKGNVKQKRRDKPKNSREYPGY